MLRRALNPGVAPSNGRAFAKRWSRFLLNTKTTQQFNIQNNCLEVVDSQALMGDWLLIINTFN